jgi:hypothetical protein
VRDDTTFVVDARRLAAAEIYETHEAHETYEAVTDSRSRRARASGQAVRCR